MRGSLARKPPEHEELSLPIRDREMELPQPLRQRGLEALRIRAVLEAGNVVVGKTDQAGLATTLARKDPLEPQVEDVMEVDVREDRRNRPPCDTPSAARTTTPLTIAPARSQFPINRKTTESPIQSWSIFINHAWLRWSK